jgi:NADP-reducing hydrogenase subunit HndA
MSSIKIELREEDVKRIKEICASFRNDPQELINVLHRCQEYFGYLPAEVQEVVSEELTVPVAKIYGVITFYSFDIFLS